AQPPPAGSPSPPAAPSRVVWSLRRARSSSADWLGCIVGSARDLRRVCGTTTQPAATVKRTEPTKLRKIKRPKIQSPGGTLSALGREHYRERRRPVCRVRSGGKHSIPLVLNQGSASDRGVQARASGSPYRSFLSWSPPTE